MFNNSSHVDASHSTFSEVHRDQYYNVRSDVQGSQTINTIIHGNQIVQDSSSNLIETLQRASVPSALYDSAQRYPAPRCIEGTRIELLDRITTWADEPDQKPICWLNGRPGSGKSAVSQTMAEKYASQNRLAASFFFSRRDLNRRTTQHIIPTLTTQLLSFLPSIRPAVIAAVERDYMIPMKVLREQMDKLLFEPLSSATEAPNAPFLIVVDALDECDEESLVSELVTLLALLPRKTSLPLRLLITSRSEPWLQSRFRQPDISALTLSLDIHAFSAEEDIRSYLHHALDKTYDQHLQIMKDVPRPWPSLEELEHIVNKSGGLFIFALTVVKFVGDKMHNPVERLRVILGDKTSGSDGSAYADLDSLYRDAISVFPDADIARLVLGLVYCMAIPLSIPGLHRLLQRPDVDARIVVPALSSVLLASEDGKQPIQFYHASFRDFLITPQRSKKYAINPDVYHRLMAQLCFETMSNSLKRDMCGIGDPSKANSEIPDLVERRQAVFDEALLYACRFWSRHLAQLPRDGAANEALLNALKRFSTTVLLHWIEALSILGEIECSVVMLREAIIWLRTLCDFPEDSLTLLEDADRLVVLFMDAITQCALHVYVTAMIFIPTNSAIYKTFKHQLLGTFSLRPDRDEWTALRRGLNLHDPIHSVVFSPDGHLIATGSAKQGVQLWNTVTGENVASFGGHSSAALLVRFSPSGAFLAAAFESGAIAIWDPKVGRQHMNREGCHTQSPTCLEFSKNSALLASGARDRVIWVWSTETAEPLYNLTTHEGPVTTLIFSSDSTRLFSGSEDNLVTIWDMTCGKLVRDMTGHRKMVNCVAVSQDGNILVSGSEDKTVKLWDTGSGKCVHTFSKGHQTGIRSVYIFDEDKRVVTSCDEVIILWNLSARNISEKLWAVEEFLGKVLKYIPSRMAKAVGWGAPKPLLRFLYHQFPSGNQQHMNTAYATRSASFVFTNQGYVFLGSLPNPMKGTPIHPTIVNTIAISPDGNWAASANHLGSLDIFDLTMPAQTWEALDAAIKSRLIYNITKMIPSPNGSRFVVSTPTSWKLIDDNYRIIKSIDVTGVFGPIRDDDDFRFRFSADGSIFYAVISGLLSDDKSSIRVFDSITGEQRAYFTGLKKVHSFVSSADGTWIACSHGSSMVEVFDVLGGSRRSVKVPDDSPANSLVFSDDAQSLVGGFKSGSVRVWDRASGECKAALEASTSMVTALACTGMANGASLVCIGREDGSLSLWSPSTSVSHEILGSDQATVKNIDFIQISDDRTKLTSRGEEGIVSSWAISFEADNTDMAHCTLCPQKAVDNASSPTFLPHLLSQSDPDEALDSLFHTGYRVRKDGWLVNGERRMVWFPPALRPRGKDTFYAYENGLVIFYTPTDKIYFLKLGNQ